MGLRARVVAVVLCFAVAIPALAAAAQKPKKSPRKSHAKQAAAQPLPSAPSGPLPQMPLDSVPAVAPEVSYEDGNLTILAHNSSLTDILKAVQAHTGASIDVPPTATDRVVTNLGPGPARDVLAKLLNGSHYNYVMLGSVSDPNAVSKIVLTSKVTRGPDGPSPESQAAEAQTPQPAIYQGMPQPPQMMRAPNPQAAMEAEGEEAAEPEPEAEEGNDPAEEQDQDGAVAPGAQTPAVPGQQGPKTPEQLLQELQRQQLLLQQQQQQQQQQGQPQQPNPNQPPQE